MEDSSSGSACATVGRGINLGSALACPEMATLLTLEQRRALMEGEYHRLAEKYRRERGKELPPFPGLTFHKKTSSYASCHYRRRKRIVVVNGVAVVRGFEYVLLPFTMSVYLASEHDILHATRHETAHAAAILFNGHTKHGPTWRKHAEFCETYPRARVPYDVMRATGPALAMLICKACGATRDVYRRRGKNYRSALRRHNAGELIHTVRGCPTCGGKECVFVPNPGNGHVTPSLGDATRVPGGEGVSLCGCPTTLPLHNIE